MENQDSIDARFTLHSTTADQAKKSWQTMTRMRRETAPDGTVVFHVLFAGDDFEKKITRMTGLLDPGTRAEVILEKNVPDVDAQDLPRAEAVLADLGFQKGPDGNFAKCM